MRMRNRMLAVVLSLILALSLQLNAEAEEEAYTYTVRLFSGQQGTFEDVNVSVVRGDTVIPLQFSDCDTVAIKGLMYGDRLTFDVSTANMILSQEGKYYVKGIRESGKDNQTIQNGSGRSAGGATASFPVECDTDYVVGYGLLVDAVAYTVNYQDADGNALAPSRTYYGNVGDKPVVAYLYIDGYQPQAYNITGTLQSDSSKNVFTFVYTPAEPGRVVTNTIVLPGTTIDLGTEVIPGVPGGGGGTPGGPGGGGADEGPGGGGEEETLPDDPTPTNQGPDEVEDLDEEETPTGNFPEGIENAMEVLGDGILLFGGLPLAARAAIIAVFAGAVGLGVWAIAITKKKKEQRIRESEEDSIEEDER